MNHLPVLFGYEASDIGNSHVPLSLCRHWDESGRRVSLTVPGAIPGLEYPWLRTAIRGIRQKVMYKFGTTEQIRGLAEKLFLKHEKDAPVVYLWAGLSMEVFAAFHALGCRIVVERINCHRRTAWRLLDMAADAWGIPGSAGRRSEADAVMEERKLQLADAVFCPSPMVRQSMLDHGVAPSKLLSTSYGWSPERFARRATETGQPHRLTFLFAGSICLRKGVPLLLEAWKRAGLDAELVLCGAIDPELRDHWPALETYRNVRHVAYTRDIGALYRKADVFVFPSLEEGGPMVTYEAMAHGIPCLVTAMGGGAIVQDGTSGTILPDMDGDAWAAAMTAMAEDAGRRSEIGRNARLRADEFTWKNVADQRAALLEGKYPSLWQRQG